ncbi:hypothetical protein AgCh_016147 [Apium graveolens]
MCIKSIKVPCEQRRCYIYNPSTDQLAILPRLPGIWVDYIGLAFDPSKSPHYKVIAFVPTFSPDDEVGVRFHIYSSKTKTWRVCVQSFALGADMYFDRGIYWKGCVHWLSIHDIKYELASDVPDGLYFLFDAKNIPKASYLSGVHLERSFYFGESEDHLHFTEVCPRSTSISVYEMKSNYSEWFLKYQIDLAPISKAFPEMTGYKAFGFKYNYAVELLSVVRRENFEEDSFLVLGVPGKILRYNLVDGNFDLLWDFVVDFAVENVDWGDYRQLKAWQYIETLSCV